LLIVQGVAEVAMVALALLLSGDMLSGRPRDPGTRGLAFDYFPILWLLVLLCGLVKVAAGVRNRTFRARTLGYVALLSALPTAITVLCAPSGLAIMVYGLVAYRRPDAKEAFTAAAFPSGQPLGLR
jgi:hypothetical protein